LKIYEPKPNKNQLIKFFISSKNQEIFSRSNTLTILSFQKSRERSRSNALTIIACQIWEDRFKVQLLNNSLLFSKQIKRSFQGPTP